MKKTGECPKCGRKNIYFNDRKMKGGQRNWLSFGFSSVFINTYICTDCGYIEDYISDSTKFEKIRDKWKKL
jgi:predicted nucleic-acid-binding Zn-ribbon protein